MPEVTHGRSHPDDQDRREPPAETIGVVAMASGVYALHADGAVAEEQVTVVAVIYDRLATPSRAYLQVRLDACREYAAERGWTVTAEHVDTGDAALDDRSRPGLDAALDDVRSATAEPATDRAVLLVYDDGPRARRPPRSRGQPVTPRPTLPRRDRSDRTRGAHRRPRHVLADLPPYMPGGLVAAFGVARRGAAAGAVALLAVVLPWWFTAPQTADTKAADLLGHSVPDPVGGGTS